MTHLRKKLLILGTVACVLGAVQTASAAVQPAGTGEPLYTNSAQNTQWFEWPATTGIDGYRVQYSYYENNALVAQPTVSSPNGASNVWANWSGVKTLQHGGQYGICAQGSYVFPNDSLWISDGPNSCSMGTALGRRASTTIDRSKPSASIALAGGAAATKDAKVPIQVAFSDDVAGPFPANFMCFQFGGASNICDASAGLHLRLQLGLLDAGRRREVDDVHLHRRLRLGRQSRAGRAGVGVRDRRRRVDPRQPERPEPGPAGREGQSLRRQVRRRDPRPHRARGVDRRPVDREVGDLVSFGAQASDATSGVAGGYDWSFGDNTGGATGDAVSHTFTQAGTYEVRAKTVDGAGNQGSATKVVTVSAPSTGGDGGAPGGAPTGGSSGGSTSGGTSTSGDDPSGDAQDDAGEFEVDAPRKLKAKAKALRLALTTGTAGKASFALVRSGRVIARGSKAVAEGTSAYKLKLPPQSQGRALLAEGHLPADRRSRDHADPEVQLTGKARAARAAAAGARVPRLAGGPVALPDGRFHGRRTPTFAPRAKVAARG